MTGKTGDIPRTRTPIQPQGVTWAWIAAAAASDCQDRSAGVKRRHDRRRDAASNFKIWSPSPMTDCLAGYQSISISGPLTAFSARQELESAVLLMDPRLAEALLSLPAASTVIITALYWFLILVLKC